MTQYELVPRVLAAVLVAVVVLAGCQQAAFARPQLTFSSSSVEDEVGHVTESRHNQIKTVAGQHQSGFVRQATGKKRQVSGSRAAKPAEAALLFDGPLKGLVEMPLIKELSALILPRLDELLKSYDQASTSFNVGKKFEQNLLPKTVKKSKELGLLPAVVFGSKSDGSNGLFNGDSLKIPQFLQQLGSALPSLAGEFVSATGQIIGHAKPVNTINQIGSGLVKGARSANEPSVDFNRLLEGEQPKGEQAAKLFRAINALLEESVFLGKGQGQSQNQRSDEEREQQQQQQQQEEQEEEFFF